MCVPCRVVSHHQLVSCFCSCQGDSIRHSCVGGLVCDAKDPFSCGGIAWRVHVCMYGSCLKETWCFMAGPWQKGAVSALVDRSPPTWAEQVSCRNASCSSARKTLCQLFAIAESHKSGKPTLWLLLPDSWGYSNYFVSTNIPYYTSRTADTLFFR